MKQTFIIALLLLSVHGRAQEEQKHYTNHHRFELSIGAGQGFGGYAIDKKMANFSYAWAIKNSAIYSSGLSVYITKRISVGVLGNLYKWDSRYAETFTSESHVVNPISGSLTSIHRVEGKNSGYSACLTGNYDLPYRSSIFYGGVNCGIVRGLSNQPGDNGILNKMDGVELNVHIGYKLTLVQKRFWLYMEVGTTSDISKQITLWNLKNNSYVSINNYPLSGGLKFRI